MENKNNKSIVQSPFRDLGSRKWILPSEADGYAFMIRALKAEEHLKESLELLLKTKESIPQRPAQETKDEIHQFLKKFQ